MDDQAAPRSVPLSNATLGALPADVARPGYDRAALRPGIVHIGLGNFHRAHQAWYLHKLMQQGVAQDWAILGAGVRSYDAEMREKLLAQDCLTTLIELSPNHRAAEVIGPMIDYLPVEPANGALVAAMADPRIRIVALTVTEGGYYLQAGEHALDAAHPDILHDVAHPDAPRTAFGAMVAALRQRRAAETGPFTGLSCDNLSGNGDILQAVVIGLARLQDPELADWIEAEGAFPNSMVDCIVPATGPDELALARDFGINDAAPVSHENFRQWVLEDKFCDGRPAWDRAGATFTDDIHAYEMMKLRILNAGHQMLANAGELLSLATIADCMADAQVAGVFRAVQTREVLAHVAPVPDMSPDTYLGLIERRFANPAIHDTTRRVAFDGASRHRGFVVPIIADAVSAGAPVDGLALVEALWCRMCLGHREDGSTIDANDPIWPQLNAAAHAAQTDPTRWLDQEAIYGALTVSDAFADRFAHWLDAIKSVGVRECLKRYLQSGQG